MNLKNARAKTYPNGKRGQIHNAHGYVSISLSNQVSVSAVRLQQIFGWARGNLSAFDVLIGDYFHRHNLEDLQGLSQIEALERALDDGRLQAGRVRNALNALSLHNVRILYSSEDCSRSSFAARLGVLERTCESSDSIQGAIDLGIDAFLRRMAPDRLHAPASRRHSWLYQLEELAVFELLAEEGYSVNVYPGAHLPVMKEIIAGTFQDMLPTLSNVTLVELRFRRR